ncbi:aldehyde dehydrogenase family protein [Streptomyces sp. McG3]|uniref:aldehyde dehydrogenase family protein n=1 Tax=Streptomyces sp. McG3 TaxID=2725483 RepID=UPI001BE72342|nr:aldehyde dehydrogenase family protein [Streptomyces sp. McG3]MBT2901739.1 aldehyde dehydrogenase family protein [Streptomyces sp. McG3]
MATAPNDVATAPPGTGGGALPFIDALVPAGAYRTGRRETVRDVAGEPLAELSLVPGLYIARTLDRLRREPAPSAGEQGRSPALLARRLRAAGEAFASDTLGGLTPKEHDRLVARSTGVPVSVVRAATATIADVLAKVVDTAAGARPRAALPPGRRQSPNTGAGAGAVVWRRRGRLLGVNASGNHPAVHSLWLEALALGYRVAVRPSRRDPFTPHRLVLALRSGGFADDEVLTLPCDHGTADELVGGSDLAMVFGGDATVRRYAGGGSRTPVLTQGPGRVKVLVRGRWEPYLDVVADSVGGLGGVSCLNATAVLVEHDARGFAEALAERLAALRPGPPEQEDAQLPCLPLAEARRVEDALRRGAAGCEPVLGDTVVHDLGDGSAALRPAVHLVDDPTAEQLGLELPFPCVWVAPWSPDHGAAPLRGSLVVGVAGGNTALVDALLDEPSIRNVYGLDRPTWWLPPEMPHDGYLAEFLMRSTALAGI